MPCIDTSFFSQKLSCDCSDILVCCVSAGISCVGESGESANMTECLRWAGPLPLQVKGCRVSCKDDCTLTAWSKFSDCARCGSSRSRKRSLTGKDFSHVFSSLFYSWTVTHCGGTSPSAVETVAILDDTETVKSYTCRIEKKQKKNTSEYI